MTGKTPTVPAINFDMIAGWASGTCCWGCEKKTTAPWMQWAAGVRRITPRATNALGGATVAATALLSIKT